MKHTSTRVFEGVSPGIVSPPWSGVKGDIMHKRNAGKLQARRIRGIILRGSFYDRNVCEVVSRVSRLDVMARAPMKLTQKFRLRQ
jgi:hypothetical protein